MQVRIPYCLPKPPIPFSSTPSKHSQFNRSSPSHTSVINPACLFQHRCVNIISACIRSDSFVSVTAIIDAELIGGLQRISDHIQSIEFASYFSQCLKVGTMLGYSYIICM